MFIPANKLTRETTLKQFETIYGCKYKGRLKFDFYLPDYNICIEFDGEQHFKPVEYWGGEEEFKKRQIKDKIKTSFCTNNDIKLIRIHCKKMNKVDCILSEALK